MGQKRKSTKHKGNFNSKLDRTQINLLLNLRRVGWSYNALSSFFGISLQGARYQCEKYGIHIDEYGIRIPDIHEAKKIDRWRYEDGERINVGKSYADYLKEARNRFTSYKR